jgi:hypothetical protein
MILNIVSYETPLWNYISAFDPLAGGLMGLLFTILLWFMFIYPSFRRDKNAISNTFYLMIPPLVAGGIINMLTGNSLFAGFAALFVYLIHLKKSANLSNKVFFNINLNLWVVFIIFSFLPIYLRIFGILALILRFSLESEIRINLKKDEKS